MASPELHFGENIGGLPVRQVWTDYGEIGESACRARIVLAENGQEYVIKGPSLTPELPFVGANELIAARLASMLELPILDCCLMRMGGRLYFGSQYLAKPAFYPQLEQGLLDKCENRDRAYDVVAFDCWIANVDRHPKNFLVRVQRGNLCFLLLNDHSHCLYSPGVTPAVLTARIDEPAPSYVKIPFLRERIIGKRKLEAAIKRIQSLPEEAVVGIVKSAPPEFLPTQDDRDSLIEYLLARRNLLEGVCFSGFFPLQ